MMTEQLSQGLSIAAAPIAPQTLNNSTQKTGGVDMSKFKRALFLVAVGSVTAGGSLTARLQESVDTTDGNFSDVAGGAATAVTASTKIVTMEERADQLSAGKRYLRVVLTETASHDVVCACVALGGEADQKPGSSQDVAAVAQRLVL
jgi:hypothetical protein